LTHLWLPSPSGLWPTGFAVEPADDEVATVHPFEKSRLAG
jgi:hypothetical protein